MTPNTDPRIRGWVESNVTYLEMRARPDRPPVLGQGGIEVHRAVQPTVSFYRYLYETIGADWTWSGRRLMGDAALAVEIEDPELEVNVLWVKGVPAGLIELDHRSSPEIKLSYFGLIPDFVGRGFGKIALDWMVDRAWSLRPSRLWLHTCDLDHPNAPDVYKKAGFIVYDRGTEREAILHDMPPPRRQGMLIPENEITPQPSAS